MFSRTAWVAAIVLVLGGCGEESPPQERPGAVSPPSVDEAPGPDGPAVPEVADDVVATPEVVDPFEIGDTRELGGLVVTYLASGGLTVRGTDRWGHPIDSQFENGEYFRNALPTLSRSVSDEQAAMLRDVADHIPRAEAPAAVQPSPGSTAEGASAPH